MRKLFKKDCNHPKWRANATTAFLSFHRSEIGTSFPLKSETFTVSSKSAVSVPVGESIQSREQNFKSQFLQNRREGVWAYLKRRLWRTTRPPRYVAGERHCENSPNNRSLLSLSHESVSVSAAALWEWSSTTSTTRAKPPLLVSLFLRESWRILI